MSIGLSGPKAWAKASLSSPWLTEFGEVGGPGPVGAGVPLVCLGSGISDSSVIMEVTEVSSISVVRGIFSDL